MLIKNPLLKLMAFLLAVLAPIHNTLIAIGLFILIDLFTGCWKSIKFREFSARRFAQTISKFCMYFLALLTCQLSDMFFDLPKITGIVAGLIVITEVTSILENIAAITGVPLLDRVITLFKREKPNSNLL